MYRVLGDRVGSVEAQELAAQLVAWHDAMVKHARVAGPHRTEKCQDGCPHEEALSLWAAALALFGEEANRLAFLRRHGGGMRPAVRTSPLEMRA